MVGVTQRGSAFSSSASTWGRGRHGARDDSRSRREASDCRIVLLVEDEVLVRMMIADELRDAGFTVIETANPDQALDVLTHAFDVKLVLSDVQMPGAMDGLALARLVRAAYPAIKIVLTSGRGAAAETVQYDGFFPKPCDAAAMVGHIRTLLD